MNRRSGINGKRRMGRSVLQTVLLLVAVCLFSAQAASEGQDGQSSSGAVPDRPVPRQHHGSGVDERVKTLTHGLDLDAMQQTELRALLQIQGEQVRKIWNDPSIPAPYRISATQAIRDQTADQIRALLNEEQRKKFNQPRPSPEVLAGSTRPSVEAWMDAARVKQAE